MITEHPAKEITDAVNERLADAEKVFEEIVESYEPNNRVLPRYPVFIPTKSRWNTCYTARVLLEDGVPFYLVVEPHEWRYYAREFGEDCLLVLPAPNMRAYRARTWIKHYSIQRGDAWHWQLDDNIQGFYRRWKGYRIPCAAGVAFRVVEDFVERFENIAIAGLNYTSFCPENTKRPPFNVNVHVYSCFIVNNKTPHYWRLFYNDDTDYCLQVIVDGWCTVLFNAFLADKMRTMTIKGGMTSVYDPKLDGRLKMARMLERAWPYVVETTRRFRRPQHIIRYNWRKFAAPLIPKQHLTLPSTPNEYGMRLVKTSEEQLTPAMRKLYEEWQRYEQQLKAQALNTGEKENPATASAPNTNPAV